MKRESNHLFKDRVSVERFLCELGDNLVGCSPMTVSYLITSNLMSPDLKIFDDIIQTSLSLSNKHNDYSKLAGRVLTKKISIASGGDYELLSPIEKIKKYVAGGRYSDSVLDKYSSNDINAILAKINLLCENSLPFDSLAELGRVYSTAQFDNEISEPVSLSVLCFCLACYSHKQKNRLLSVVDLYNEIMARTITFDKKSVQRLKHQIEPSANLQCTVQFENKSLGDIAKFVADMSFCEKFGVYLGNTCLEAGELARYIDAIESCGSIQSELSSFRYFMPYWFKNLHKVIELKKECVVYLDKAFYELLLGDGSFYYPSSVGECSALTQVILEQGGSLAPQITQDAGRAVKVREWITRLLDAVVESGANLHIVNIDHCLNHGVNRSSLENIVLSHDMSSLPIRDGLVIDRVGAFIMLASLTGSESSKKRVVNILIDAANHYVDVLIKQGIDTPELSMYRGLDIKISDYDLIDDKNFSLLWEACESLKYYATLKSVNMAKEFGSFDFFNDGEYQNGLSSLRSAKIESGMNSSQKFDWAQLTNELKKHGIRNSFIAGGVASDLSELSNDSLKIVQKFSDYNQLKSVKFDNGVSAIRDLIMAYKSGIRVIKIMGKK